MARLCVRLFGGFDITLDGERVTGFDSNKVRALLAYLTVEASRAHRRESLAALLWPGYPEASARTNLRNALANLRTAIADHDPDEPYLLVTRETLQWNRASDAWLDVAEFRQALAAPDELSLEELEGATGLYSGDFLAGFTLGDSAAFDEWLLFRSEALKDELSAALVRLSTAYAAQGELERAIAYARRRLALDPLHEPAHVHLMLLYAQADQRAAALRQYETCRRMLRAELGVEPSARTQAAYERLLKGETAPGSVVAQAVMERTRRTVGPCPYRGLAAFGEADASFFFGREAFVDQLERALDNRLRTAMVIGPSGSGKSSVVFAGLLPRLRAKGDLLIATLRPGKEPFQALSGALLPHLQPDLDEIDRLVQTRKLAEVLARGDLPLADVLARILDRRGARGRVLLVVDQFEELFTLCADPGTRRRFIDALLEAGTGPTALLLTLRGDFVGQALAHRPFADALQTAAQILGPMTREELRAAIEKPAEAQGAAFEAGLVARLLDGVGEEPGNLPLLEFALTLLWERLDFGWMTHAAYEAIGRVEGALARYADEVYTALATEEQALARRVFIQLMQPGEGTEDTRRVATRADVGKSAWALVQRLADRRLVVTGRDEIIGAETVEVVHEALIRSWGRLQTWMAEDRAFRTWQERLRVALRTWESTGHDEGALLRGMPLAEAEEWLRTRGPDLSEIERAFVEAGLAAREAQRQAEREAARQLQEAHELALRQAAIGLASEARLQMEGPNQDLAVLLALEAVEHYPYTWQAELALAQIVLDWRLVWQFSHGVPVSSRAVVSPDGKRFATLANDGVLRVWDLRNLREPVITQAYLDGTGLFWASWSSSGDRILTGCDENPPRIWEVQSGRLVAELVDQEVASSAWAPDGERVVSPSRKASTVLVWDARTGQVLWTLSSGRGRAGLAWYSPDGKWIASSRGDVWDAATGDLQYTLAVCLDPARDDTEIDLHWSPDGTVFGGGLDGTAWVWDTATGRELLKLHIANSGASNLWWSPDGDRLLTTSIGVNTVPATLWNAATGERLREIPSYETLWSRPDPWSPDGRHLLLADQSGRVAVWEAESGRELLSLPSLGGEAYAQWIRGGSGFLTVGVEQGIARIWHVSTAEFALSCWPECPPDTWDGFDAPAWSPDGNRVARPYDDGSVRIWDVASRLEVVQIQTATDQSEHAVSTLAWSPDGKRLLTGANDGAVEIWDSTTGRSLLALAGHNHYVMGVSWSPDGRRVLTCGRYRAVIWDAASGETRRVFTGQRFLWGAWSPDGERIVLVDLWSWGGPVKVWCAETGEALLSLLPDDFGYGTPAVAWSPDGRRIVTFSTDMFGRLWNAQTGDLLGTFAIGSRILVAEWSPSASRFLVGSCTGVHVWDAASLQEVVRYPVEGVYYCSGCWSPDGKHIAIGYPSGDLQIYPAWQSLEELIAYARAHCVLRELTPEERARYGLPAPAGP